MKIDCYLSEHCGSFYELRENIGRALRELHLVAEVEFHAVSYDEAVALDIAGSPTIRLDGKDLFETTGSAGITCRAYPDASGKIRNAPSSEQIRERIRQTIGR